jgi:uncharacterized membrane protein
VLFLPTAPNITTGFVMEVEEDRVEETGERVEEALTRVLSAGFAESAHQIPVKEAENPARSDDDTATTVQTESSESSGDGAATDS